MWKCLEFEILIRLVIHSHLELYYCLGLTLAQVKTSYVLIICLCKVNFDLLNINKQNRENSLCFFLIINAGSRLKRLGTKPRLISNWCMQTILYHMTSWSSWLNERNFPLTLLEKKQTGAFFPISPRICADTYLFSFPPPSQSVLGEITALFHGNCQTRAGVTGSPADRQTESAGVQLTLSANVKRRGLWSCRRIERVTLLSKLN